MAGGRFMAARHTVSALQVLWVGNSARTASCLGNSTIPRTFTAAGASAEVRAEAEAKIGCTSGADALGVPLRAAAVACDKRCELTVGAHTRCEPQAEQV